MTSEKPEGHGLRLQDRMPGQAVISEFLAVQGDYSRSPLGRVFGASPLTEDARSWYQGALGEIRVGKILAGLGPEWTVLHAVPVGTGTSDIDHVLIGPAGVFTLNTKYHAGQPVWAAGNTLMVAGRKQRHIYNSEHEADRAAKLLAAAGESVPVTPVLVIAGAKSVTVRKKPPRVTILADRQLLRWLTRRKPVLSPEQVAKISTTAGLPETWHRNPSDDGDPAALLQRFTGLQQLVNAARRRRVLWALAGLAIMGLVLANLISGGVSAFLGVHVP